MLRCHTVVRSGARFRHTSVCSALACRNSRSITCITPVVTYAPILMQFHHPVTIRCYNRNMDLHVYNTLILSDLHLGAETSHAREATRVLKENRFQRLILLGDIFADLNFARLTKEHWKFLGYIRKLSNPKRNIEVVWVEGNHDHGLANIMSHLVGVRVYQDYEWDYRGLRHVAIHGHQFDGFQVNRLRLSRLGTSLYLQLQKLDFKSKPIARLIDRLNTRWLRMSPKVSAGALAHAQASRRGADFLRAYARSHPHGAGWHQLLQLGRVGRFPAYLFDDR